MKRLQKIHPTKYNQKEFKKDNVLETLNHYKKLSVIYVDNEENVIFLWEYLTKIKRKVYGFNNKSIK